MHNDFRLPPTGFGPGSQHQDETLEYMPMPQDMRTYSPHIPDAEAASDREAIDLLRRMAEAASDVADTAGSRTFDLSQLPNHSRSLIAEVLGEGEVSIRMRGIPAIAAQESVFAGIWVLKGEGIDLVEVAPIPRLAKERAFSPQRSALGQAAPDISGLANAPALIVELLDKSAGFEPGRPAHVINLTLLPHTEPDLEWLSNALGEGSVTVLSRGYGNCRIEATATPGVWRVQFFNSMDALILDTFEVTEMPEVAIAAAEDLIDSASRIEAVLEAIQ